MPNEREAQAIELHRLRMLTRLQASAIDAIIDADEQGGITLHVAAVRLCREARDFRERRATMDLVTDPLPRAEDEFPWGES